ncbi:MAG: transpeptidase family protein, partial [Candidatus Hydrogenedentes bacterium]|nr:transpeptidase family protein [Candidatus Hydrogenedentota bacterium]
MKLPFDLSALENQPRDFWDWEKYVRLRAVLWAFLCVFCVIGVRLYKLHTDPDEHLSDEEVLQIGRVVLDLPRGDVLDRNKIHLATERRVHLLAANPSYIKEPAKLARLLADALGEPETELYQLLTKTGAKGAKRKWVPIKRDLLDDDISTYPKLKEYFKDGRLHIDSEPVRFYPQGSLAAHITGYTKDGHGIGGVEQRFEELLDTKSGYVRAAKDGNAVLLASRTVEFVPPQGGAALELTIDVSIQHILETELQIALDETQADAVMGVLVDPFTGAIYAAASLPAYDPNNLAQSIAHLRNRIALDMFEPGSAFKIVIASAALEHGLVTPETLLDCKRGVWNLRGRLIHDTHPMGVVPFRECFQESSNIAMSQLGEDMPRELFSAWIDRFGFGRAACPDLPAEFTGNVRPVEEWTSYSAASLAMGQEISCNMLQLTRAFSVIANGGYLVDPYLVERAVNPDGAIVYTHERKEPQRVLKPETARIMKELCHLVVTDGTGSLAGIPEYRVGGKTGTAQVSGGDVKGYHSKRYTSVFAGFAPVGDPRICAVIVVNNPKGEKYYGGKVCGPVFREAVRKALVHLECPEDPVEGFTGEERINEKAARLAAVTSDPLDELLEGMLAPMDFGELPSGDGDLVESVPRGPRLPNFRGMTKRQAKETADRYGIYWTSEGSGWVVAQEPEPGIPLSQLSACRLIFSTRERAGEPAQLPVRRKAADVE